MRVFGNQRRAPNAACFAPIAMTDPCSMLPRDDDIHS
jgi:hypothetical protein